jgi:prepilin-type processing-associated H-X9-DG protein
MMLAAQINLNDHQGWYPLAGNLPGDDPVSLNDDDTKRYTYLSDNESQQPRLLAPITIALAKEMAFGRVLGDSNNQLGVDETANGNFIRHFLCPSQATSASEIVSPGSPPLLYECIQPGTVFAYTESQSYIYNEGVLGWDTMTPSLGRLRGQASKVRQPALTFFAADGVPGLGANYRLDPLPWPGLGLTPPIGMYTIYNNTGILPVTLGDAFKENGKAGDSTNFDKKRHQGKINVAFCDGHVETRNVTFADMQKIYILAQ